MKYVNAKNAHLALCAAGYSFAGSLAGSRFLLLSKTNRFIFASGRAGINNKDLSLQDWADKKGIKLVAVEGLDPTKTYAQLLLDECATGHDEAEGPGMVVISANMATMRVIRMLTTALGEPQMQRSADKMMTISMKSTAALMKLSNNIIGEHRTVAQA